MKVGRYISFCNVGYGPIVRPLAVTSIRNLGYFVARIDDNVHITSKEVLMKRFDLACQFPDYFGFNWDALKDCLADFSWQPAKGYILIFESPQELNISDARILRDIVNEVSKLWADDHISFKLLIPSQFLELIN